MNDAALYGVSLQRVSEPKDLELARQLSERLDLVESLILRWQRVSAAGTSMRSELFADDRHTAWRNLSHTVTGAINLAVDNLRSFRDLVRPAGALVIPQVAHYSFLRSALEGGSLALWIVESDEPKVRIERLLKAAAAELQDDNALSIQIINALANDPETAVTGKTIDEARKHQRQKNKKHANQIRGVAEIFGLDDPTSGRWKVGYAEIVREATGATGVKPYYGETTWRMISGLCHPSLMRSTARSSVQEVVDNGDGTFNAVMTSDLGLTRAAFEAAFLNTSTAIDIFGSRKLKPADNSKYPDR